MLRIGFVLQPGFQIMSLAAVSAFEFANLAAGEDLYTIRVPVRSRGPAGQLAGHLDRHPTYRQVRS